MNLAERSRRWPALVLLFILVLLGPPAMLSQTLSPDQMDMVQKVINLHRNLSSGRLNSPGAQLHVQEVARAKKGDFLVVNYQLFGSGFTGDRYDLVTIPITPKPDAVASGSDLLLAKDGQVMDGPDDPRTMILPNFVPGEPFRVGLLSKDKKEQAFASVVPNPIQATDHGCSLDVVRLLPRFEIAFVEGVGFPADTDVDFEIDSLGEIHDGKVKTDSAGHLQTTILPFVKDKSKGQTKVVAAAPHCEPKLLFHWGTTSE